MNDMHLLLTDTPHEAQAHAAIVVTGGTITSLWSRPSYGEALDTLRRWYAVRRTMYAIDEVGLEGSVTEEQHGPDPATATIEEITAWYSDGDSDYVLVTAIDEIDPVDRCLLEEIPAYAQEHQGEARLAVLGAVAHLNEMKPATNDTPGTGRWSSNTDAWSFPMNNTAPLELQQDSISDGPLNSFGRLEIEATIHALEQQVTELEEARYEALREVRDATRRAAELSLQAMETRMRLCALIECEPLQKDARTGKRDRPAVLQLAHMYFDEPGKYRLVLRAQYDGACMTSEQVDKPEWCSKVVYDSVRPEGKGSLGLADAVRAAYRVAETRGYRLVWTTTEIPADHKPGSITSPGQYSGATEVLCHEQEV